MKIKVGRATNVSSLVGCILTSLEQHTHVAVSAVGAAALNQMFKAVALVCAKLGDTVRCTPRLSRDDNGMTFCIMNLEVIS
jgi:stage V sporulation protein SpoVS